MNKILNNLSYILRDVESPYVRLAEIEYSTEFRHFVKTLGRRPTEKEAKLLIVECR